jgi:hypothetical protein
MRGSRFALAAALLAAAACGGEARPSATVAPSTAPVTTAPATPSGPSRSDVGTSLRNAAIAAEEYQVEAGTYPNDVSALGANGFEPEPGVTVGVVRSGKSYYCLKASGGGVTLYFASDVGKVSEKPCS